MTYTISTDDLIALDEAGYLEDNLDAYLDELQFPNLDRDRQHLLIRVMSAEEEPTPENPRPHERYFAVMWLRDGVATGLIDVTLARSEGLTPASPAENALALWHLAQATAAVANSYGEWVPLE